MQRLPFLSTLPLANAASLIMGNDFVSWSIRAPRSIGAPCSVVKITRLSLRVMKLSGIVTVFGPAKCFVEAVSLTLSNLQKASSESELLSVSISLRVSLISLGVNGNSVSLSVIPSPVGVGLFPDLELLALNKDSLELLNYRV